MIRAIVRWGGLLYRGWMAFAKALGFVNTRILLGLFFYLCMTPLGFLLCLLGKDLLRLRLNPGVNTYWIPKAREPFDPERYKRQF